MSGLPTPPGLMVFADAYQLSDETVQTLTDTWHTIRGRRPQTQEEWARLWELVMQLIVEENDLMRDAMNGDDDE